MGVDNRKTIRKNLRLSAEENRQLLHLMQEEGTSTFSQFFRQRVLTKSQHFPDDIVEQIVEKVKKANRQIFQTQVVSSQLEKVYNELHRLVILGQERGSFTKQEIDSFYALLNNILDEYNRILPLSEEFKERYFGSK